QGNTPGEATIFAKSLSTGAVEPLLEVSVLFPKVVRVASHLVTDPDHTTAGRSAGNVNGLFDVARKVFLRQANIILSAPSAQGLDFTTRLSDTRAPLRNGIAPITGRTVGGDQFPVLTRRGDGTSRINAFFVWEWEPDTPDTDAQVDDIPGHNIIYED